MDLRRFLMGLTLALVVILAIVVWFFPSDEDFRTENPFWNGINDISSSYPVLAVESLSDLPSSSQGSTLILIPYLQFNPAELEALDSFIDRGGTLVLADDYGYGNQILQYLGLRARFSGQSLLDPLSNYKNERFPQISRLKFSPFTDQIDSLILNHATCLTDVNAAEALALSSSFSFLDLNGDQIWQEGEPTGPLPVISHHDLGNGEIILISDPSLFINSMETMASNDQFIQNMAAITKSNLLIDQSHLPPSNLHQTKNLLAYIRSSLVTPLGTLGLVILTLTITLMPLWHERRRH
ncbi:MAG: DUF4350 domain-containing protein [Dehalococcoidales bacterium]